MDCVWAVFGAPDYPQRTCTDPKWSLDDPTPGISLVTETVYTHGTEIDGSTPPHRYPWTLRGLVPGPGHYRNVIHAEHWPHRASHACRKPPLLTVVDFTVEYGGTPNVWSLGPSSVPVATVHTSWWLWGPEGPMRRLLARGLASSSPPYFLAMVVPRLLFVQGWTQIWLPTGTGWVTKNLYLKAVVFASNLAREKVDFLHKIIAFLGGGGCGWGWSAPYV